MQVTLSFFFFFFLIEGLSHLPKVTHLDELGFRLGVFLLTPKNGSYLCCTPQWKVSVPPIASRKMDFQSHERKEKRTIRILSTGDPDPDLPDRLPKVGLADRPCLLAWPTGWALPVASLSLSGVLPIFILLLSTFSLFGKNIPSPQGHVVPRQSSMSMLVSPGWLFYCFLHLFQNALRRTGISEPIHFPNDLLALLCGTVIRNGMCPHLFPVRALLWCTGSSSHMLPFCWCL